MENQIRVANNEAYVVGTLKEKNISFKSIDNKLMATGNLVIATETKYGKGEVRVSVMQNALTREGKENSLYKGLVTVNNEYKSIQEVGEENADVVKIKGQLSDETYYSTKKNDFVEKLGIRGTFINRINRIDKSGNTVEDCVKVGIEGCIADMQPDGDRLKVKIITVGYRGVAIPIDAIVDPELVGAFQSTYQVGATATFYIAIVNTVVVTKAKTETIFGEDLGEVIEREIIEYKIFGGGDVDYNTGYTNDQIRQALSSREIALEEKKQKAIEKESSAPTMNPGFGTPNPSTPAASWFGTPNTNSATFEMPQAPANNFPAFNFPAN